MDFFQRQEIARRNTKMFEVYFVLSIFATIFLIYVGSLFVVGYLNDGGSHYDDNGNPVASPSLISMVWNPPLFLGVAATTVAVILFGSLYKIAQLSGGGSVVAEMLGGKLIDASTATNDERKLLNVVEEMAIASGTPVPRIYVLPSEETINAFAAGHSTADMIICVNGGTLKNLKRDELQGVIGHEFSHILNGDMKINLRLMGFIFGILCLAIIGKVMLQMSSGEKKNPLPLIGLLLLLIGSIGVLFAKLIKSAVSRQREFLADASSVQFTRNPAGLANALKKVGGCGSRLNSPHAEDASHLFFANGLTESIFNWMSTHPPLEERIRELDPAWDGQFVSTGGDEVATDDDEGDTPARKLGFSGPMGAVLGATILAGGGAGATVASSGVVPTIGRPTAQHLEYAADIMTKLPEPLNAAAHDPMSAVALIYALLMSRDESIRRAELAALQADPAIQQETARLLPLVTALESAGHLPLATLSITALRNLSPPQYAQFSKNIEAIIAANGETDLFAYVLQKIVLRRLAPRFNPPKKVVVQFRLMKDVANDAVVLLSALACAGQTESSAIADAFREGAVQLGVDNLQLDTTAYDLTKIDAALDRLNQATPQIKKTVINACAETVAADGVIEENEAELLRAIADTLDCPIPPFLVI